MLLTSLSLWWKLAAWPWLKKNWRWVLFPIGALVFLAKAFGGSKRPPENVTTSRVHEAAKAQKQAKDKAEDEIGISEAKRDAAVEQAHKEREHQIAALDDGLRRQAEALQDDPEKLNVFLKNVGKGMRQP